MKRISNRNEIGKALNFGTYSVLTLDLKDKDEYGYVGCKVRIDFGKFNDGSKFYERGELRVYNDEKTFKISAGGCGITAGFGYHDIMEDLEYVNAPIIKANDDIIIVVTDSRTKTWFPLYLIHTGKINKFCMTPIELEKVTLEEYEA